MGILVPVLLIFCGLILISVYFPKNFLKSMGNFLNPIGGVLGVIALVLGVLGLVQGGFSDWGTWTMTLAGVILSARLIPAMSGMANFLNPAGGIVGILAIIAGVMGIL